MNYHNYYNTSSSSKKLELVSTEILKNGHNLEINIKPKSYYAYNPKFKYSSPPYKLPYSKNFFYTSRDYYKQVQIPQILICK